MQKNKNKGLLKKIQDLYKQNIKALKLLRKKLFTRKVKVWEGDENQLSPKQFLSVLRMLEANKVLEKANFGKLEKRRKVITEDILFCILNEMKFQEYGSKQVANYYLKTLPIYESIKTYNLDDLALAISNHYHPSIIPVEIKHITGLMSKEAVQVCRAILDDFDPTAPRMQSATAHRGEFKKYVPNAPYNPEKHNAAGLYFNAVETRRAYQYQSLYGIKWEDTDRYKALYGAILAPALPDPDETTTEDESEASSTGSKGAGALAQVMTPKPAETPSPSVSSASTDEIPDDSDLVAADDDSGVDVGYEDDGESYEEHSLDDYQEVDSEEVELADIDDETLKSYI
ncbi:hypothetical protein IPC755_28555 [Pseudomonas aeruginosa]|uniref:hypothetical protein n=1 Tax=Pseudomonas aeruginosa TaxID=287 RepID=UPI000FC3FA04|nr:hypothetical protein [Pseudomonas aeruginosa]RUG38105.1 hypothetical protein IPC755_28555 [Pseudomonas aeruginosa]